MTFTAERKRAIYRAGDKPKRLDDPETERLDVIVRDEAVDISRSGS